MGKTIVTVKKYNKLLIAIIVLTTVNISTEQVRRIGHIYLHFVTWVFSYSIQKTLEYGLKSIKGNI